MDGAWDHRECTERGVLFLSKRIKIKDLVFYMCSFWSVFWSLLLVYTSLYNRLYTAAKASSGSPHHNTITSNNLAEMDI